MKVLTLHQPWASLIALGVKSIETRSWRAPESLIGQRFAIHAAAKVPVEGFDVGDWSVERWRDVPSEPCMIHVPDHGASLTSGAANPVDLPLGCIVATAVLDDCVPMVGERDLVAHRDANPEYRGRVIAIADPERHGVLATGMSWCNTISPGRFVDVDWTEQQIHPNLPYGDFRPGRWAWLLRDVEPVTETCPKCRGRGVEIIPGPSGEPEDERQWRCSICTGATRCDPIPARGKQRLWEWQP